MTELLMSGHDRTYLPPRSVRHAAAEREDDLSARIASGKATSWDLLAVEATHPARQWAESTLDSILAAAGSDSLGCTDCEDTGFYGLVSAGNVDLLDGLLRRVGSSEYESLQADGVWTPWTGDCDGELLSLELAEDLADAITAGAPGLLRKYCWPLAFLPPTAVTAAAPAAATLVETGFYAIVDDDDPGAVMQLVRVDEDALTAFGSNGWEPWEAPDSELLAIYLDDDAMADVQRQMGVTAAGLVADAPLTVSPNPKAEKLRRYWSTGKGGAKIKWHAGGDFRRCVRQLRKYLGARVQGYCANLHKRNTGMWPGDRRNRGLISMGIEQQLVASLQSGLWSGESERNPDMAELKDGIYCEVQEDNAGVLQTLTAGGFPVAPPDEWYANPEFTGPTPMQIDDDGRVRGHIATFDVTHIGMAGAVHAPKSKSGYAYFMTGALKTASGKQVNVGQLTLSGGHAPLHADAGAAVKHYDDTNSGVADVAVGEDRFGIWAAGSLRPSVTPEQVRVFRASPLSGDWRPINGNLELVAACAVNVPGFPTARARVAGGAILALVAAGARPLAIHHASMIADAALLERLDALEARIPLQAEIGEIEVTEPTVEASVPAEVPEIVVTEPAMPAEEVATAEPEPAIPAPVETQPVAASTAVAEAPSAEESSAEAEAAAQQETPEQVQPEATDKLDPEQVRLAREDAKRLRRDFIRHEIHGS